MGLGAGTVRKGLVRNGVGGALLLAACLALAADPLQPPVLLAPGAGGGGGNLASQCSDGIDNDGDGKIDWVGRDGGGDTGCPTPDYAGGECTDPECAPDPHAPGVGLASLPATVTGWPGHFNSPGQAGCPSGSLTANTVYQYCRFDGGIYVDKDNVTCYGCLIRASGESAFAVRVQGGHNFRLLYSRVEPTGGGSPPYAHTAGYEYGYYLFLGTWAPTTMQRSHMVGYANAVLVDNAGCGPSSPCTFRGNVFENSREDGGGLDHTDGIGCTSNPTCLADNLTITGNTFIGWQVGAQEVSNTNAIAMQEGSVDNTGYANLVLTRNYITGWGYALALEEGPANNKNNLVVNNWFGTEYQPRFGPMRQWSDSMGIWAANRWNVDSNGAWRYPTASDDGKFWYPGDGSTAAKHATDYNGNTQVPYPEPACNDGVDNDGDGNTDYPWDSGCTSPTDTSE